MTTNGSVPSNVEKSDLAHNGESHVETKSNLEPTFSVGTESDKVRTNGATCLGDLLTCCR
jgi:hypothetical protein